jgi:hypothetical protein
VKYNTVGRMTQYNTVNVVTISCPLLLLDMALHLPMPGA